MATHYPVYLLWTDPELNLKLTNQEAVKQKQTPIKRSSKYQITASNSSFFFLFLLTLHFRCCNNKSNVIFQEDYEMIKNKKKFSKKHFICS